MRVAVATIEAGRPLHLARQAEAMTRLAVDRYLIISMGDVAASVPGADVIHLPADADAGLPLAGARNRALAELADADLVILLDVDCIPGSPLLGRYVAAAREAQGMFCGPVGYLAPLPPRTGSPDALQRRLARGRVIRAFPTCGIRREPRPDLFWSLSFALAPSVHRRIGGFDEGYRGWGAEDTDYGLRARAAEIPLWLVGGAWAYHQHHPPSALLDPAHVAANARRFHRRWGYWPMPDQLARLARAGRLNWTPDGTRCDPQPSIKGGASSRG